MAVRPSAFSRMIQKFTKGSVWEVIDPKTEILGRSFTITDIDPSQANALVGIVEGYGNDRQRRIRPEQLGDRLDYTDTSEIEA